MSWRRPAARPSKRDRWSACLAVASHPSSRLRLLLGTLSSALRTRADATTASADFSPPSPRRCRRWCEDRLRGSRDLPGQVTLLRRETAGFTRVSVRVRLGFAVHCPLTPPRRPDPVPVRRHPTGGFGFLQIPPRDGHSCLALRFRSPRPAEDFHLLKRNMPGTQRTKPMTEVIGFKCDSSRQKAIKEARVVRGGAAHRAVRHSTCKSRSGRSE